jgi:hypothetical protein
MTTITKRSIVPTAFAVLLYCLLSVQNAPAQQSLKDVVGFNHIGGRYEVNSYRDYVNEGGDEVVRVGSRVIKIWFHPNATCWYSNTFNPADRQWGWINLAQDYGSQLILTARQPNYRDLFTRYDLMTYVLVVMPAVVPGEASTYEPTFIYGNPAFSQAEHDAEYNAMYALTKELMATYANTYKTFIIQNHEGDWLLRHNPDRDPSNPNYNANAAELIPDWQDPSDGAVQGMIDWLGARQSGVAQARADYAAVYPNVTVLHAAEVNRVTDAYNGRKTVTNNVIPYVNMDLYSYSVWDVNKDRTILRRNLDYLADKANGVDNVYVGEVGCAETEVPSETEQSNVIQNLTDEALDFGARYVLYWNVFCNEYKDPNYQPFPGTRDAMKGFWLERPDSSYPVVWFYFHNLFSGTTRRHAASH